MAVYVQAPISPAPNMCVVLGAGRFWWLLQVETETLYFTRAQKHRDRVIAVNTHKWFNCQEHAAPTTDTTKSKLQWNFTSRYERPSFHDGVIINLCPEIWDFWFVLNSSGIVSNLNSFREWHDICEWIRLDKTAYCSYQYCNIARKTPHSSRSRRHAWNPPLQVHILMRSHQRRKRCIPPPLPGFACCNYLTCNGGGGTRSTRYMICHQSWKGQQRIILWTQYPVFSAMTKDFLRHMQRSPPARSIYPASVIFLTSQPPFWLPHIYCTKEWPIAFETVRIARRLQT